MSPTKSWIGVAIAARGERDHQAEPVVAVTAATEHPHRVHGGDQKAGDDVGRQEHVEELVAGRRVEEHLEGPDVGDVAGRVEVESLGLVHPGVHGDHGEGATDPGDHDRHRGEHVRSGREPVPAVDVDGDEDRLEEEEDPLDREADSEGVTEAAREPRPQQAELEGEDGAGHRADGEEDRDSLRPVARQAKRLRVLLPMAVPLGDQHRGREGHAEAGEHDVEAEGEPHLGAGRQQVRRGVGQQGDGQAHQRDPIYPASSGGSAFFRSASSPVSDWKKVRPPACSMATRAMTC